MGDTVEDLVDSIQDAAKGEGENPATGRKVSIGSIPKIAVGTFILASSAGLGFLGYNAFKSKAAEKTGAEAPDFV